MDLGPKASRPKRPLDSSLSASNISSPDATPVKRQYKRARILSSDDDDDESNGPCGQPQGSSQSTLGQFSLSTENSESAGGSQTVTSPEQIEAGKVKFLQGAFPTLPRNVSLYINVTACFINSYA